MQPARTLLAAALGAARRRYRLPSLPPDAAAARAAGHETALAFAIERRRLGAGEGDMELQALFTRSLAALIAGALAQEGGDPAFQALLLRARSKAVQAYTELDARRVADERALRSAVHAFAHPGRLRGVADASRLAALEHLQALLSARAWDGLHAALEGEPEGQAALAHPALERLRRLSVLQADASVQRYLALCAQRGPIAGSAAAAAMGREGARSGAAVEAATVQAFTAIAALLGPCAGAGARWRVLRGVRTPAGFPGDGARAKDEWDVVLACEAGGIADILLLAEAKAAAASATNDYARLQRGLHRLAQVEEGATWAFDTADGPLRVDSRSLRQLSPNGRSLPPHVIYTCTAPPEPQPVLLGAAARAVLLAEPASVGYALAITDAASASPESLGDVWRALGHAPHLRAVLHQHETMRLAREAMLHPEDLVAAVRESCRE